MSENGTNKVVDLNEVAMSENGRGIVNPADPTPDNYGHMHWVECAVNGTYVNYSNLTANAGDKLRYNREVLGWQRSQGDADFSILNGALDFDGYKGLNVANGVDNDDTAAFGQIGKFPFVGTRRDRGQYIKSAIIKGADPSKFYYLKYFYYHDIGIRFQLALFQADNKDLSGTTPFQVASYSADATFTGLEEFTLNETSGSGISAVMLVDFTLITTLSSSTSTYETLGFLPETLEIYIENTRINKYPFIGTRIDIGSYILSVQIYGANESKFYYFKNFHYKDGGTERFYLKLFQADDAIGTGEVEVSRFQDTDYTETTLQTISLPELSSSGITANAIVDFSKFSVIEYANYTYLQMGLIPETLISNIFNKDYIDERATVISDSAISADVLDMFPIISTSDVEVKNSVKNMFLAGADPTKFYFISTIERAKDYTTKFRWQIYINEADDCNSLGTVVAYVNFEVLVANMPYDETGIQLWDLIESGGSGITGRILIDWEQVTDGRRVTFTNFLQTGFSYIKLEGDTTIENSEYLIGDNIKQTLIVNPDGSGDAVTLTAALATIIDSSFLNQYLVYMYPGDYTSEQQGIQPPPYVHIKAVYPRSVRIIHQTVDGSGHPSCFELTNSCKLTGLQMIVYDSSMYAMHPVSVNKYHVFEDCDWMNLSTSTVDGNDMSGDAQGQKMIFRNCKFISVKEGLSTRMHTTKNAGEDRTTELTFENCSFGRGLSLNSYGSATRHICTLVNCDVGMLSGIASPDGASLELYDYPYNINEWIIGGSGNRIMYAYGGTSFNGEALKVVTTNVNEQVVLSGTAVGVLFGNYKTRKGDTLIKGNITGFGNVIDEQMSVGYPPATDVIQMWKRLGDCSVTPKTLIVTVDGGTPQQYDFNINYETVPTPEVTILAAMNAFFTNCEITKESMLWKMDNVRTTESGVALCGVAGGILKDELIYIGIHANGNRDAILALEGATQNEVAGIALEDAAEGEELKYWRGTHYSPITAGEYGIGADNKLSLTETEKVGVVVSNYFFPYY